METGVTFDPIVFSYFPVFSNYISRKRAAAMNVFTYNLLICCNKIIKQPFSEIPFTKCLPISFLF